MLKNRSVFLAALLAMVVCLGTAAQGSIIYETPSGSTQGSKPVSAQATFSLSTNQITITLENLQADPQSAANCVSGLEFHVSTGQSSGTLSSSSGTDRTINGDGTWSDGSVVSTGWALNTVGSDLMLNLLGTGTAPTHEIVGPPNGSSVYTGNSSITNGSHNPHIGLSATFTLNVPGVTASSTISSATFQFNTSAGSTTAGQVVPEPASAGAIGALILLIGRSRRRR